MTDIANFTYTLFEIGRLSCKVGTTAGHSLQLVTHHSCKLSTTMTVIKINDDMRYLAITLKEKR